MGNPPFHIPSELESGLLEAMDCLAAFDTFSSSPNTWAAQGKNCILLMAILLIMKIIHFIPSNSKKKQNYFETSRWHL